MFNVKDKVRITERIKAKGPAKYRQMDAKVIFANDVFITVEKKAKEGKYYNTSFMMNDIKNNTVKVARI